MTDGQLPLRAMVDAAIERGYEYCAVTDHSKRVTVAGGLDADGLRREHEKIDRLNEELSSSGRSIQVLKGVEVDILEDGTLDLDDEVLSACDVVVCSVHFGRSLSEAAMTKRILTTFDNPNVNIMGHPTGRIVEEGDSFRFDVGKVMKAALDRGIFLEANAQPKRLDLSDVLCRRAKEMGVKLAISTDARTDQHLSYLKYGVSNAHRAWLEPGDIINTRPLPKLRELLAR